MNRIINRLIPVLAGREAKGMSAFAGLAGALSDMKILDAVEAVNGRALILDSLAADGTAGTGDDTLHLWSIDKIGSEMALKANLTSPEYGYSIVPIAWMKNGTSGPDALNDATGRSPYAYRTFDSVADEDLNFVWFVPSDLGTTTTLQYRVHYLITAATGPSATEGTAWSLAGVSMGDNDATNASKGTAVTVHDDTINAAQWDTIVTPWSGDVTVTNIAAGEVAEFNFERTTGDAVDDYGQLVGVYAVEIRYQRVPVRQ